MRELDEWFLQNRREFPWREMPTPYRVWISEVMLQQTRASVVISYFERWMSLFPDTRALAAAPLEKVIKTWEGLGYYSRARNLHRGAQQIVEMFGGEIPSRREELELIRGLGPYTIGAILSFGFRQRAAAVDGNVMRVLTRFFCIEENVSKQSVRRALTERAEMLLSEKTPWVTAEALIELGATLCTPKPRCEECPLQRDCAGHRQNKAASLPIKNSDTQTTHLKRVVLFIEAEGKVLVKKGEAGQVMADLYEFPYLEMGKEAWSQRRMSQEVERQWGIQIEMIEKWPEVTHTFTRYKAHLYPFLCKMVTSQPVAGYQWMARDQLAELPFSSGHRRILQR